MYSSETERSSARNELERDFPGIVVMGGCDGGGNCPKEYPCIPVNEFFLALKFKTEYPTEKNWSSFHNLMRSIAESDWEDDKLKDAWVRMEFTKTISDELIFRIHGHNVINQTLFEICADDPTCPIAGM